MSLQAYKIKVARMQHRLEEVLTEIHTIQMNNETIPIRLLKKALERIRNLVTANRDLRNWLLIEKELDEEAEEMVYTHQNLLILASLEMEFTNKLKQDHHNQQPQPQE